MGCYLPEARVADQCITGHLCRFLNGSGQLSEERHESLWQDLDFVESNKMHRYGYICIYGCLFFAGQDGGGGVVQKEERGMNLLRRRVLLVRMRGRHTCVGAAPLFHRH